MYCYAIPLYRHTADADDPVAALRLALLLAECGDLDQAEQLLRARADVGDGTADTKLADLLARRGSLDRAEQIRRAQSRRWPRGIPGGWLGC